jgi:hypothetical protein
MGECQPKPSFNREPKSLTMKRISRGKNIKIKIKYGTRAIKLDWKFV